MSPITIPQLDSSHPQVKTSVPRLHLDALLVKGAPRKPPNISGYWLLSIKSPPSGSRSHVVEGGEKILSARHDGWLQGNSVFQTQNWHWFAKEKLVFSNSISLGILTNLLRAGLLPSKRWLTQNKFNGSLVYFCLRVFWPFLS